jgi:hypothetical protein
MKRVIRPGPLQYGYLLLVPALIIIFGLAMIAAGFGSEPPDWASRLPAGVAILAPGLFWAAYVVGMRVEVDDTQVSKLYLFGLLRETIPFAHMAVDVSTETDQYENNIQYLNFANIDGRGAFTLLRGWVWPGRDVDDLFVRAQHVDTPMRRQNWILAVFALALPLSGIAIFVIAIGLLVTHLIFHWPS